MTSKVATLVSQTGDAQDERGESAFLVENRGTVVFTVPTSGTVDVYTVNQDGTYTLLGTCDATTPALSVDGPLKITVDRGLRSFRRGALVQLMPNVVFTKNSTPVHAPYGAVDTVYEDIEDVQIRQGAPDFNYAPESPGALGPDAADLSIMLFRPSDAHQIPSNATNVQCRLYFYTTNGFDSFTIEARQILKPWARFSATFNDYVQEDLAWETAGALGATDRGSPADSITLGPSGNQWWSLDVDSIGAALIADPRANHGLGVFPVQPDTGFWSVIKSDGGPDGQHPEIHFSYDVPEGGVPARIPKKPPVNRPIPSLVTSLLGSSGGGPNAVPTEQERLIKVFGHSLFDHDLFGANQFTSTGVPMGDMSRQSFDTVGIKQIFGQLRDQTLPPPNGNQLQTITNQVDPWPEGSALAWGDVGWTDVIIMASNFEQLEKTPAVFAGEADAVLDYVETNAPSAQKIIYEHWGEPSQYGLSVINTNEMSPADWDTWKELHRQGGSYHTWHVDFQDEIALDGHPVTMIPVGAIIADALQTQAYLSAVAYEDLFVDNAPHPNATMSFMVAAVCYIALFGQPNANYVPIQSSLLNSAVLDNRAALFSYFEQRLAFYGANGVNLPT